MGLIPEGVDENRITATYADRVLEVVVPKGAVKDAETCSSSNVVSPRG